MENAFGLVCFHFCYRKIDEEKFLPMLMYILTHGNVTVYEWKHDEPPPSQNQNVTEDKLGNGNVTEDLAEIDWGDTGASSDDTPTSHTQDGIDLGESGIDFGESEIDFGADVDISSITIEDSGEVGGDEIVTSAAITTKAQPSGS